MILVLCSDEDVVLRWRRLLFSRGFLSSSVSYRYAINTHFPSEIEAVLIPMPHDPAKPMRFCYSWHPRHPDIPVVMITSPLRDVTRDEEEADIRLSSDLAPAALIDQLLLGLSAFHGRDIADCVKGPARDHMMMPAPTWGGVPFHLTPTERTIFRYLLQIYPQTATAKELLRNCSKPGTSPTLCNIPSHIYRINLKANEAFGHHVIGMPQGIGYRLLSPDEL